MPQKYKTLADYFEQTGAKKATLAEKLGVSPACVSYWISRKREPSPLRVAVRVSEVTGVPIAGLTRLDTEDAA